jgi:hypothetical protein
MTDVDRLPERLQKRKAVVYVWQSTEINFICIPNYIRHKIIEIGRPEFGQNPRQPWIQQ